MFGNFASQNKKNEEAQSQQWTLGTSLVAFVQKLSLNNPRLQIVRQFERGFSFFSGYSYPRYYYTRYTLAPVPCDSTRCYPKQRRQT